MANDKPVEETTKYTKYTKGKSEEIFTTKTQRHEGRVESRFLAADYADKRRIKKKKKKWGPRKARKRRRNIHHKDTKGFKKKNNE